MDSSAGKPVCCYRCASNSDALKSILLITNLLVLYDALYSRYGFYNTAYCLKLLFGFTGRLSSLDPDVCINNIPIDTDTIHAQLRNVIDDINNDFAR